MRLPALVYLAAVVQAAAAAAALDGPDGQYSPFSDALLARSDDELRLVRRAASCQTSYKACATSASALACCPDSSVCTHDAAGNVACCPTSALCTGVVSTGTAATSLTSTATASTITSTTTATTGVDATTTAAFSSAELPTSGVQGGGSTVSNAYYPFVYIPTSYADAALCLSAYSYCQAQSTACAESLAGIGVTVSVADDSSAGITVQGAASTTVNAVSASSICSSLSEEACYGLTSAQCGATAASTTTTATSLNHAPGKTPCPAAAALYAVGAGAFAGGLRILL